MSDSNGPLKQLQLRDIKEEEKKERRIKIIAAVHVVDCVLRDGRERLHCREGLDWDKHVHGLNQEGPNRFHEVHRMRRSSRAELCQLIDPLV